MKNGSFTGINGFSNQDMACQESMGPIVDRTAEHLGTSDIAIIRMRKRMLEASAASKTASRSSASIPACPTTRSAANSSSSSRTTLAKRRRLRRRVQTES